MDSDPSTDRPATTTRPRRRWVLPLVAAVAVVVIVVAVIVVLAVQDAARPIPTFPSLTAHPDSSLHGTVAYYSDSDGCVRLIAASGRASKDLLCLPKEQDVEVAKTLGKLIGPQLAWRPDGRLEVTMFRMKGQPVNGAFEKGWQKLVDPTTGAVEEVAADHLPTVPDEGPRPLTNEQGLRISVAGSDQDGDFTITLTERSGTARIVLELHGPGMGGYHLNAAYWSPDGKWIVLDDSRLLILRPGPPSRTRVLTAESTQVAFGENGSRFAVTATDLLTASSSTPLPAVTGLDGLVTFLAAHGVVCDHTDVENEGATAVPSGPTTIAMCYRSDAAALELSIYGSAQARTLGRPGAALLPCAQSPEVAELDGRTMTVAEGENFTLRAADSQAMTATSLASSNRATEEVARNALLRLRKMQLSCDG